MFDTWGRSLRGCYGDVGSVAYVDGLREHLRATLGGTVAAHVAHPPVAPTLIVAWVIGLPPYRVDYCYTRGEYRRGGCMRRLLQYAGYDVGKLETYSRLTSPTRMICRKHGVKVLPRF